MVAFNPDNPADMNVLPGLDFRFCNFYLPAEDYHVGAGTYEPYDGGGWQYFSGNSSMTWQMRDCQLYGGHIVLGDTLTSHMMGLPPGNLSWTNNLFEQVQIVLDPNYYVGEENPLTTDFYCSLHDNLIRGGQLVVQPRITQEGNWQFFDNSFDKVPIRYVIDNYMPGDAFPIDQDNNGYWPMLADELNVNSEPVTTQNAMLPVNDNDGSIDGANSVTMDAAPPYQSGPLDNYYLPDTTPLYGAGSDTAANLGLYHYTTRLDQVKEGDDTSKTSPNTMANIGLHYIAVDGSGKLRPINGGRNMFDHVPPISSPYFNSAPPCATLSLSKSRVPKTISFGTVSP